MGKVKGNGVGGGLRVEEGGHARAASSASEFEEFCGAGGGWGGGGAGCRIGGERVRVDLASETDEKV